MDWMSVSHQPDGSVIIPPQWLHIHYYEAFNILFRFENALRLFVYVVLKKNLKDQWMNVSLSAESTIKSEAKKRKTQANDYAYLGDDIDSPMLYLDSGHLIHLITSDASWKYFAGFFRAKKEIVKSKLQEIGGVRNALAHFRPLNLDDIELVKVNIRNLFLGINECFSNILNVNVLVPSNLSMDWFKKLKDIRNEYFSIEAYSSSDSQWIRLELVYKIPIFEEKLITQEYFELRVGDVRTMQLLSEYSSIKKMCIFINEEPLVSNFLNPRENTKKISMIFCKKTIESEFSLIISDLLVIASKVESETLLLKNDSRARGDLIESKVAQAMLQSSAFINSQFWHVNLDKLKTLDEKNVAVEYWGVRNSQIPYDLITSTSSYPWMKSSISVGYMNPLSIYQW
jgi:hypothetical protein